MEVFHQPLLGNIEEVRVTVCSKPAKKKFIFSNLSSRQSICRSNLNVQYYVPKGRYSEQSIHLPLSQLCDKRTAVGHSNTFQPNRKRPSQAKIYSGTS